MRPAPTFGIFVFFVASVFVPSVAFAQTQETVAEVRVHGNHTTPDGDVLAIAGLEVGEPATEARLQQAARALIASRRFEDVEVRRRYRSIANPSEILVILWVDEHPAVTSDDLTPGPLKRFKFASMWLPILNRADGYGFTYGGRVSFVDVVGDRSRVSVPLTWGGERRAAVEIERTFNGPLTLLRGTVAAYRRVNPHFEQPDTRIESQVDAERAWTGWLRSGVTGRVASVRFADENARHSALGVNLVFDTRVDPSFPRNAVHAHVGWERLWFSGSGPPVAPAPVAPAPINLAPTALAPIALAPTVLAPIAYRPSPSAGRWLADLRGYIGVGGSAVLALRGRLTRTDSPLPLSEQSLLGGSDSLRGYRAGYLAGDSVATISAEARFPLNSPLSFGRFGVKAFVDAGTSWMHGARLSDQRFDRGIGGGIYFGATALVADLDVAWPEQGNPRVHFGLGVSF